MFHVWLMETTDKRYAARAFRGIPRRNQQGATAPNGHEVRRAASDIIHDAAKPADIEHDEVLDGPIDKR